MVEGDLRPDGKCMARIHFNSALFPIAAVYRRTLKITVGGARRVFVVNGVRGTPEQVHASMRSSKLADLGETVLKLIMLRSWTRPRVRCRGVD